MPYGHTFFVPEIYDPNSIVFSFDSIYWTVGIKPIIDCIHSGATRLITTRAFSPELQLKMIEEHKISILYIPPFNLIPCLKSDVINKTDLLSMRTIYFYGCKLTPTLIPIVNQYFPNTDCVSWYGMTEIGRLAVSKVVANDCLKVVK